MSVHFDVSKISFFGLDEWSVAVCAWRGCCMEVFSRAEHSVADCLTALEGAGIATSIDARNPFASKRLKALSACIKGNAFGGHGTTALTRIAEWERIHESRALLAHGVIRATTQGITIRHSTYNGKAATDLPPKQYSRWEMLEALGEMEAAQRRLHQQLGHIKALAGKIKPVANTRTKPTPDQVRGEVVRTATLTPDTTRQSAPGTARGSCAA